MRCSKCGADNREGAKFCSECATPFAAKCPRCGAANTFGAKFCDECAASLTSLSPIVQSAQTFPVTAELTEGSAIDGERKTVTALFADLKGSTELIVLDESGLDSSHLVPVLKSTQTLIERFQADGETASSMLGEIIERVDLMREGIRLILKLSIAEEDRIVGSVARAQPART
jgi:hypothetical protein